MISDSAIPVREPGAAVDADRALLQLARRQLSVTTAAPPASPSSGASPSLRARNGGLDAEMVRRALAPQPKAARVRPRPTGPIESRPDSERRPCSTAGGVEDRVVSSGHIATDAPVTALVAMPFGAVGKPSIQLGVLRAVAAGSGFSCVSLHLLLDFAAQVGVDAYESLSRHRGRMLGDWLFAVEAFGADAPDPGGALLDAFAAELSAEFRDLGDEPLAALRQIRDVEVPAYLDRLLLTVPWDDYDVIGFTCTHQQTVAAVAMARRLKRAFPHVVTVFGGANLEDPMGAELVRRIDAVDYAVVGEAEEAFPALLRAVSEGRDPSSIRGVLSCRALTDGEQTAPVTDMNTLPDPDYDEYFERAEALGLLAPAGRRDVVIPFQAARGCWWGQKHHCTFCGLNGATMEFRSQPAERVLRTLAAMSRRYRSFRFQAVDNILPRPYVKELFPQLAESECGYTLYYEVKSNLDRATLKTLREGGVMTIQPGIESLSTPVLKLMNKGVTAIQNVNTLRWAGHYGISVDWNVLWGFPGEQAEDVEAQLELIKRVGHLQPPVGGARIWLERFSPLYRNLIDDPRARIAPEASYRYVYPDGVDLGRVAYFFDHELPDTLPDEAFTATVDAIRLWRQRWHGGRRPTLTYRRAPGFIVIEDARREVPVTHPVEGDLAALYLACSERPRSARGVAAELGIDGEAVEGALDEFVTAGLMMKDSGRFLSLAVPAARGRG